MTYLDLEAFLRAVTNLAEEDLDVPGLGRVRIRELTAAQRVSVLEQARVGDGYNDARYWAAIVAAGLVEPKLGPGHIEALFNGRDRLLKRLSGAILRISNADGESLQGGDPEADGGQLDAQGGDPGPDGGGAGE